MKPGAVIAWLWAIGSWSLFGWGLVESGKVSGSRVEDSEPARHAIDLEGTGKIEGEYTSTLAGKVELSISLYVRTSSDRDLEAFYEWEKRDSTVSVDVRIDDESGKTIGEWQVHRDKWKQLRGGTSERLVIAKSEIEVAARQKHSVHVEVIGVDSFFSEHEPRLHFGAIEDATLSKHVRNIIGGKGRRPGVILVIGLSAAFIHGFFLLARIVVPFVATGVITSDEMLDSPLVP